MAAKVGDKLVSIRDQPMRTGHYQGANHIDVRVKNGITVLVEKVYVEQKTGIRRYFVSFVDDSGKKRAGWVRQNDSKNAYFESLANKKPQSKATPKKPTPAVVQKQTAAERRAAAEEHARALKAERLAAEQAREAAERERLAPLQLKKGDQIVPIEALDAREKEKPKSKVIVQLPPDKAVRVEAVKKGKDGVLRAKVALSGQKKRVGWIVAQESSMEKRVRFPSDEPVNPYRQAMLDEIDAEDEFEKLDRERASRRKQAFASQSQERVNEGKDALQKKDYAKAVAVFNVAAGLLPDDAEIDVLLTEARCKYQAEELAVEAAINVEHDQLKKAEDKYRRALELDPEHVGAAQALAELEALHTEMGASIDTARKEAQRKKMFSKLDDMKAQCERDLESLENRNSCIKLARECRKALSLDPEEQYPDRKAFKKINNEAADVAATLKLQSAAQQEMENNHVVEAIALYKQALAKCDDGLAKGFTTQAKHRQLLEEKLTQANEQLKAHQAEAAEDSEEQQKEKEAAQAEQGRANVLKLKEQAVGQLKDQEYHLAEHTIALALTGTRYLDEKEILELQDLQLSAKSKSEAQQLAAEADEQILHEHFQEALSKCREALELDPENEALASRLETALALEDEAQSLKQQEIDKEIAKRAAEKSADLDKNVKIARGRARNFLESQEWGSARTEAKNALALIDEEHRMCADLKAIQAEAEMKIETSELLQQSKTLTAAGDFEGAEAKHAEAEKMDPSHPELPGIKKVHAAKKRAAQEAAEAQEAAVLRQHEEAQARVAAAETAGTSAPQPEPESEQTVHESIPPDTKAIGEWEIAHDVQVRGLTVQGTVNADFGLMESCFGAPRESEFKGMVVPHLGHTTALDSQ